MNRRLVFKLAGTALMYEAAFMVFPLIVSLLYQDPNDSFSFFVTMVLAGLLGFFLSRLKPEEKKFRSREGFSAVALAWLMCSFFGALPYYYCGYFNSFIDCMFESVSGFTTTGATILTDIESLPRGILFWRSFTQWIGGMGVLVFMMAIMSSLSASSVNLMRVEVPGTTTTKIVPKVKQTARIMYLIYIGMTLIQVVLLVIAGMPLYDSFVHTFSSAGTGGFSNMNMSVAAYNNLAVEIIITVFIFLFGVSFSLYYFILKGNFKAVLRDEELLWYFGFVSVSILVISIDTSGIYGSVFTALRYASFQVCSVITSSGFFTADFDAWPDISRIFLLVLMLVGSCAGSTGCGLKMIRFVILIKAVKSELNKFVHPRVVSPVQINGKNLNPEITASAFMYFFVYFALIIIVTLLISFENYDLVTTVTSAISTVSNTGPGLARVGPLSSFGFFSPGSKIVLTFAMLAGRLEIFPLLLLFSPSVWRKSAVS